MFKKLNIVIIIVLALFSRFALSHEVVIGVSDSVPEIITYQHGMLKGQIAPYYQCVFDTYNRDYSIAVAPNARLFRLMGKNKVDIILPLVKTPERDAQANFTLPVLTTTFVLYTLTPLDNPQRLDNLKITSIRKGGPNSAIKQRKGKVIEIEHYSQGITMTKAQRADGVVLPSQVAEELESQLQGLIRHSLYTVEAGMYVRKNQAQLLSDMNMAIDQCSNQ